MRNQNADRRSRLLYLPVALVIAASCGHPGGAGPGTSSTTDPTGTPTATDGPDRAAKGMIDIALTVEETGGVARANEPVRSGVPIPRAVDLRSADDLEIVGPNGVVPSQIAVTSRWEGAPGDASRPIKWVLVDFAADVPKDGATIYRLRTRDGGGSANDGVPLVTENAADHVTISTGAATFTLSKSHFALFDRVELASGETPVDGSATGGGFLVLPDGTRLEAGDGTRDVVVEEDGPRHAVIRARGSWTRAGGDVLDWTARMHFDAGRAECRVVWTFTERSLPNIRSFTAVSELGLDLPVAAGDATTFAFGGVDADAHGALHSEAWQRQTGRLSPTLSSTFNPGDASTIQFQDGGEASGSGGHAPGWVDLSGTKGGVTAALRWYWQLYPKKLDVTPGHLVLDLWPKEEPAMRVYAGAQKSHEVIYAFHAAGTDATALGRALVARVDHPLLARCNPSWYAGSEVWDRIGIADDAAYPDANRALVDGYFGRLEGTEYPTTFVQLRDHGSQGHSYSMWDFGDGRESYWSNLAYDTPRTLLIHWAITGDRAFFDRGAESAVHLRDVDTEHSPLDTRAGITDARGVPQPWLGRSRYTPSQGPQSHDLGYEGRTHYGFEHQKGQGLADHYFLTGDRESLDVLEENYQYYRQWKVDADDGYLRTDGTRVVSHMLLMLLGYYDAFGTDEARQRIDFCVQYLNDWQRRTTPNDPHGMMWMSASDTTSAFMNGVTAEALMLYEVDFPDGIPVRKNLVDAATWTLDPANGQLVNGSKGLYVNAWTNNNYGTPHATVLDAMVVGWLAYAGDVTGDASFTDTAKALLADSMAQDGSTQFMKAFTQETRLVPAFLYFLQTPEARREPAS